VRCVVVRLILRSAPPKCKENPDIIWQIGGHPGDPVSSVFASLWPSITCVPPPTGPYSCGGPLAIKNIGGRPLENTAVGGKGKVDRWRAGFAGVIHG
jgi:hypothetical protein